MAHGHIIYIHGFLSSPQSEKAQSTRSWFVAESSRFTIHIADFPGEPVLAIRAIDEQIQNIGIENVSGFIGSSLGGYYSLYFQAKYDLPAVLINPALRPYELLQNYLGPQKNLYTDEEYLVTDQHMQDLRDIERVGQVDPSKVFIVTQSADETLDFKEALTLLPQAKSWIQFGGSHAFDHYDEVLPAIHSFFVANTPS